MEYIERMKRAFLFLSLLSLNAFGQSIDYWHHLAFRPQPQAWFNFENDFLVQTDRYYSQGIAVCYKQPIQSDNWINAVFLPLPAAERTVGFGLDHMAFTPSSITFDSLLSNDHPYAGTIRFNILFESVNAKQNQALSWSISTGIIGKEAWGKELQTGIHRITRNPHPKGWHHQIRTGLLLDANVYAHQ